MSDLEPQPPQPGPMSGFLSSLTGLFAALGETTVTRLELFFIELQEGLDGYIGVLLWALVAVFAVGIGVFIGALALIFAFWDTHRLLVSIAVMVAFLALAAAATMVVRSKLNGQRRLFEATLNEFAKDHEYFKAPP